MCFGTGGESLLLGVPGERRTATTSDQLLHLLEDVARQPPLPHRHPEAHGWLGWISYDAGRVLEPSIESWHTAVDGARGARASDDRTFPLADFVRIDRGLISKAAVTTTFGDVASDLEGAIASVHDGQSPGREFRLSAPTCVDIAAFTQRCARVIEYIRAGDVYQVNLAHRMECRFAGSPRGLFAAMLRTARPWHGSYFEGDGYSIASASPELFLELDREHRVRTRPMKGTRPSGDVSLHRDLMESTKDRAELAMIVDLMRNDLGRVCVPGSMRVDVPREIEQHDSGVLQATATVSGVLGPRVSRFDLLRATFPAGSVTGAPKVRAMQIIDELEPVRRGPYCGSMVWLGDDGTLKATVLIRTAVVHKFGRDEAGSLPKRAVSRTFDEGLGLTMDYSVGAGIVADSVPEQEWRETLDKSLILQRIIARP